MSAPVRVLLVDDEPVFVETLARIFSRQGMEVETATSGEDALERLEDRPIDVMVCDLVMPGLSGLELLRALAERPQRPEVIMLTAHATVDNAVEAMKQGAYDYLQKPAEVKDVERAIHKAYDTACLRRENARLKERLRRHDPYQALVGASPALERVRELVSKVAPTESTVLILGESGTGKELVARMIHDGSERSRGPFLTMNCGALQASVLANELFGHVAGAYTGATHSAPGLFEASSTGSLFIDEIGEMDLDIQKTFLRVLESGEYRRMGEARVRRADTRIIAATNRDLKRDVEEGRFRKDLYYRLNVFSLEVPPLREHKEDIPTLVDHFLRRLEPSRAEPRALTKEALEALTDYDWPGNVRELRNALERGVILAADRIGLADLPELEPLEEGGASSGDAEEDAAPRPETPAGKLLTLRAIERQQILRALEDTDGNKTKAAKVLGISLRSLYTKLDRHGLRDGA